MTIPDITFESTQAFLKKVVATPEVEADLLDAMSQLEYVGTRKILKSVNFERVTADILQHITEEASHAFLLKREANKIRGSEQSWEKGRFAKAGWTYFQTLDQTVSAMVPAETAYRIVSWAIEERAKQVYPLYIEITKSESLRQVLKRIIGEEVRHSQEFGNNDLTDQTKQQIINLETTLWSEFLSSVA